MVVPGTRGTLWERRGSDPRATVTALRCAGLSLPSRSGAAGAPAAGTPAERLQAGSRSILRRESPCRFESPASRLVSFSRMGDQRAPVGRELPHTAITLADSATRNRLTIYAGAGVSVGEPTGLPSGAEIAARLHSRFVAEIPALTECDEHDLLAVANTIEDQTGGQQLLQQTVCQLADFTTAEPGLSHHILAFLLLEGALKLFTTNWDNCIEKAVRQQRETARGIKPVIAHGDLQELEFREFKKVHGCATRPSSIRITSNQLDNPPLWVSSLIQAELVQDTVVFLGVGTVTLNLDKSLKETADSTGAENIWIVDPGIGQSDHKMPWESLDPPVRGHQTLAADPNAFLDHLASAYVQMAFDNILSDHDESTDLSRYLSLAISQLRTSDVESILVWTGHVGTDIPPGQPVLRLDAFVQLLAAIGKLTDGDFDIDKMGYARTSSDDYRPRIVRGSKQWPAIFRDIRDELEQLADRGMEGSAGYDFLVAGAIDSIPHLDHLTNDIAGIASTPSVRVRDAKEVLQNVA